MDFQYNCECIDEFGENCGCKVMLLLNLNKIKLVDKEHKTTLLFDPEQVEIDETGMVSINHGQYYLFIPSPSFSQHVKIMGGKTNEKVVVPLYVNA